MMCKGTDSTRKLSNFEKTTSQNVQLRGQVNQQKTKRENKSRMRAEFKLRYKGFKSSGSLSFEDMYLHTTLVC